MIEERFREYNQKTLPVIEFYKSRNMFTSINGMGTQNEVFARVENVIDSVVKKYRIMWY